ncbi:MAG: hypothetical protein OEM93_18880 [Rhodospirillales bacterium]|nr:hypothetical protein [Rhodospirillales bacterium]MDH3918875.1 hypothetical protein [Rhodospirillales bacterium]MDH3970049.1 hypothetical protein [Rhodospirillales bacterium]
MQHVRLTMATFALAVGLAAATPAIAQGGYSSAQIALFDTPHLENIAEPMALTYDFRYRATEGEVFEDHVKMIVTEVGADGRKSLSFQYLSGSRQRPFAAIEGFRGNPLIMLFLQHDVEEMRQAGGGPSGYFRNRIRNAFRDGAKVEELVVEHADNTFAAKRITIRPFATDPNRDRFPRFADKSYEFVLAPGIPGGLYRIRSVVPSNGDGVPWIENSLTYKAAGTQGGATPPG